MLRAQLETHFELSEKLYVELNKVNGVDVRFGEVGSGSGKYRENCTKSDLNFGSAVNRSENCSEVALSSASKRFLFFLSTC